MCGMCGIWSGMGHWSSPGRRPGGPGRDPLPVAPPAAARIAQARALAMIGAHAGITVRDWMLTSWILEDRSGGSMIVETLPEVWAGVARLSGSAIDPLDETFIARMEAGTAGER